MEPFTLSTGELILDSLTDADIPLILEYCQDPLFEKFLTIPWPYTRSDAEFFVHEVAHPGWKRGDELTWAIRKGGTFLGVISMRSKDSMIGYWLGDTHRGHGYMPQAVTAVIDWVFSSGWSETVTWEAVEGNLASLVVAQKTGFRYSGIAPARTQFRKNTTPQCWHGVLRSDDDRTRKPGWPV